MFESPILLSNEILGATSMFLLKVDLQKIYKTISSLNDNFW